MWVMVGVMMVGMCGRAKAGDFSGLSVNSWKITTVKPTSFSSLDGAVRMNITNKGQRMIVTEISGVIYNKAGEMYVIGTAENLNIHRGTNDIDVIGHCSLSSYSILLSIMKNPSIKPADYTADINATIKVGAGKPKQISKTGIPLSYFLK